MLCGVLDFIDHKFVFSGHLARLIIVLAPFQQTAVPFLPLIPIGINSCAPLSFPRSLSPRRRGAGIQVLLYPRVPMMGKSLLRSKLPPQQSHILNTIGIIRLVNDLVHHQNQKVDFFEKIFAMPTCNIYCHVLPYMVRVVSPSIPHHFFSCNGF